MFELAQEIKPIAVMKLFLADSSHKWKYGQFDFAAAN